MSEKGTPAKKSSYITPMLQNQINDFVQKLEAFNALRVSQGARARDNWAYDYLRAFFTEFFIDRNKRAQEVSTGKYADIIKGAHKIMPVPTLWDVCVDGRVLVILIIGGAAKIGSSVRVPGGILPEFVIGTDGKVKLLEDSHYANLLDTMLAKFDTIAEVFDSHVGCAARGAEEAVRGRHPGDAGLFNDVLQKREMTQGLQRFVKKKYRDTKQVVGIQTSFDPHTGFLYMGLETKAAINFAISHAKKPLPDYAPEVLTALTLDHKIISTEQLVKESKVEKIFAKHAFVIDWKEQYVESTKKFWEAIGKMSDELTPYIKKRLKEVYPYVSDSEYSIELEERAMLLLASAFSGYLHHLKSHDGKHADTDSHNHQYPYGAHQEEGVWISIGGHSPYAISMFSVTTDMNLAHDVYFSAGIVRANRLAGRVSDRTGLYTSPEDFEMAPVPVVVQEVVRRRVSDSEWDLLARIDWSDLSQNWDTIDDLAFLDYLRGKGVINSDVMIGINNLRKRMSTLYHPHEPTSPHLLRHHEVAVPIIAGKSRHNHFIVPFVKLGF